MKKYFKLLAVFAVSCAILVQPFVIDATNTDVVFAPNEEIPEILKWLMGYYEATENVHKYTCDGISSENDVALEIALKSARKVTKLSAYQITGELQASMEIDINSNRSLITNTTTNHDFGTKISMSIDNTTATAYKTAIINYGYEVLEVDAIVNEGGIFIEHTYLHGKNLDQITSAIMVSGAILFDVNAMLNVENIVELENFLTMSYKIDEDGTVIYILQMTIAEENPLDIIDMHHPKITELLLELGVTAREISNIYEMLHSATVNIALVQYIDANTLLPIEGSVTGDFVLQRSFLTITANAEGSWKFYN